MAAPRYDIVLCRRETQQLTLETLATLAGMHPALVERFVEVGLIEPVEWEGAKSLFDASAIPRLRMIRRLRESLGINLAGIGVILNLLDRLCALQRENESQQNRL
ncbi:MAG TPA: chaperone modulator CbpM [Candidatus Binatia bacterium]